jgi:dihydroorotase
MPFDLLIKNATVVTADHAQVADVAVTDGKTVEIGTLSSAEAKEIIDARGLHLFPGLIDTQVHFREPGMTHKEDLESGTRAAIAGGVTTIFEMPNTDPLTTTREALDDKLQRASGRAWCDYAFFVGAATDNYESLDELELTPGTPGVKIFMGSSTGTLLVPDDETLRHVLQHGKYRCPIHAEDHYRLNERKSLISHEPHPREHCYVRDAECARLATERILALGRETGRPVHILHLSTADEIPLLEAAKKVQDVTVEITPQHLWFHAPECYDRLGTYAQMNPPMREIHHRDALRDALRRGFFDCIGSDHAPHTRAEKDQPYPGSPSGMPGVQTILPVMLTLLRREKLIGLTDLARLLGAGPQRLYGMKSKGDIRPGNDADFALVDLERTAAIGDGSKFTAIQSKCGWSPYEGEPLTGWPVRTILRGRTIWNEGDLLGQRGQVVEFLR